MADNEDLIALNRELKDANKWLSDMVDHLRAENRKLVEQKQPHFVFPTLVLVDDRPDGPFVAKRGELRLPDGSVLSMAEDSSVFLTTSTEGPMMATVDLLLGGVKTIVAPEIAPSRR